MKDHLTQSLPWFPTGEKKLDVEEETLDSDMEGTGAEETAQQRDELHTLHIIINNSEFWYLKYLRVCLGIFIFSYTLYSEIFHGLWLAPVHLGRTVSESSDRRD